MTFARPTFARSVFPARLICILAALVLGANHASAASPPPVPQTKLSPPIPAAPTPPLPPKILNGPIVPLYTLENLEKSSLSGVVWYGIRAGLTGTHSSSLTAHAVEQSKHRLTLHPNATVQSSMNASADPDATSEPSIAIVNANGVDYTTSVNITYESGSAFRLHYATSTDFASFQRGPMPSSGYNYGGDPWLDENPYAGGVAPKRVYCAGLAYDDESQPQTAPNAIALYHLDPADNGSWSATPSIVENRGPGSFLDKPAVAVSWHNSTDLGWVYVSYTSIDYTNNNTAIVVARSTDGGATFPQKTVVAYGGGPYSTGLSGAQPLVDVRSGNVYIIWLDETAKQLQFATSTDFGATFGPHEVVASLNNTFRTINGGLRIFSDSVAKYNWLNDTIDVTWTDDGVNGTDIEYAYHDFAGWHQAAAPVVQFTANDQFLPGLDYDSQGNVLVTYYDRHADQYNLVYRAYEAYITYYGTRIDSLDGWMGGFESNPSGIFIGDYQSVWDWTFADGVRRATASWIGIQSLTSDDWWSRITY